jgi:hypothetical protein
MHPPTPMVFAPFPLQDCEIGGTNIANCRTATTRVQNAVRSLLGFEFIVSFAIWGSLAQESTPLRGKS